MHRFVLVFALCTAAACGDNHDGNSAPTIGDLSLMTAEDTAVTGTLSGVDADAADDVSITVAQPAHGDVTMIGGSFTYTPDANFNGSDSFTVTVSDGTAEDTGTVSITVTPVNDAPVGIADSFATNEDAPHEAEIAALLANDTDVDGDTLTITSVGNSTNGTAAIVGTDVVFTPTANFTGSGTYRYTVSDGTATADVTVTVTIGGVNDPPVAMDDNGTTPEDTDLVVAATSLATNDTDPENQTLTVTAVADGTGGTVALAGGDVTFTPTANFNGAATFTYTVSDGADTDTGTVTVTVTAVNDAPVAANDAVTTNEDTDLTVLNATAVGNDTDVDPGTTLTVTSVTGATNGNVALDVSGNATFTPTPNFNGTGSYDYTVSDGAGGTSTATVTITINAVNDAPVAVDDPGFMTDADTPIDIATSALLANDSDVDLGTTLTVMAVQTAMNGSVVLNGTTVTFTPNTGFSGTATFEYVLTDGAVTDIGLVSITVTSCVPVNDNIACTMDICQNGVPVNLPNHLACETDGFVCTVPTCSATTGCSETASDAICNDGASCTSDTCAPGAGANGAGCVIAPNNAACSDGLSCTTDVCSPGGGSDPTTGCAITSTCTDNVACTVDACTAGGCTSTPDNSLCSAGDICIAGSGCRTPATALVVTELGILGTGTSELLELHNPTAGVAVIDGVTVSNMGGQTVAIHPASDPTGSLGQTLSLAAGGLAWGVPNPASAANIPAGATFVYGEPGTSFAFADSGDMIVIRAQDTTLLDTVDFTAIANNPNNAVAANQFPVFAGHTTQLTSLTLTAVANDDGDAWCTTFRDANTAGAANQSCSAAVINEVLIDATGTDEGATFVEIAGPGGGQIGGAILEDIEGKGATVGTRNGTAQTIPAGTRIPADGLLVVVDGPTPLLSPTVYDVALDDIDFENNGGDSIQLISAGQLLDVVGHDVAGANLDAATATVNGFSMFETATAITPASAASLARDVDSTDTNNNRNDFHNDPSPTPGAPNTPVTPTITSITPNDGLASTTSPGVRIAGTDLAAGTITVNGVNATSCSFAAAPLSATCTFPASAGGAVGAVNVVYTNSAGNGGGVATATNGWTYTGVRNETDLASEADFCNLQFPTTMTVTTGLTTPAVFGQIFEAGVTDAAGQGAGLTGEVGYGPNASNPTTTSTWQWFATTYNVDVGNNDEFLGTFTAPAAGTYSYTYRFSFDGGLNWTYCDLDGAGSNAGLAFESTQLGVLTVTP